MKWYHFTGPNEFAKIIESEALICRYRQMYELTIKAEKKQGNTHTETYESYLKNSIDFDIKAGYEGEIERNSNIFLTQNKNRVGDIGKNSIVFEFELDLEANLCGILGVSKLTLGDLVAIGVSNRFNDVAKDTLRGIHDGKYAKTPLYQIFPL